VARFLFVVPPIVGHVVPTVAVGRTLRDRGHEVAWAGHTNGAAQHLPSWASFVPVADAIPDEVAAAVVAKTSKGTGGASGFVGVWRDFVVPVSHQMAPGLSAAIDAFKPDVMVVDQQAIAGAVAAEVRGIPWATSATTSVEVIAREAARLGVDAGVTLDPATTSYLVKLKEWLDGLLHQLVVDLGLDADRAATFEPRFSPHLVLAYTTSQLIGFPSSIGERYAFVGPSIGERPVIEGFPWEWLDGRPLVLVSLGTLNWRAGSRFHRVVAEAFDGLDVQAVLVAPEGVDIEMPSNVLVAARVPQLELLEHVAAVVSHGGQNTVAETLAVGRPLVVAPIRDDQPVNAAQVVQAGAGLQVRFSRVTGPQLRDAVERVLTDGSFRAAADRIRRSFEAAGGPGRAADLLEALIGPDRRSVDTALSGDPVQ
jgi:MGT family glycosyltransferase